MRARCGAEPRLASSSFRGRLAGRRRGSPWDRIGCAALLLLVAGCAARPSGEEQASTAAPGRARPNLVLILIDDAGWADLGFQGSEEMRTPHLDALAAQSVRCEQGYVAASVCSPSRAALLTGRYPQRFGHELNIPGKPLTGTTWEEIGLPLDEVTLADALRSEGYRTGAVGKWHLGETERYRPQARGFDEFFGFLGGSRSYWALGADAKRGHMLREGEHRLRLLEGSYLTDSLTDRAVRFVEDNADQPFFLYLSLNAVHTPMHAREVDLAEAAAVTPEKRRKLAAMTASMDAAVGRLVERIDALGLGRDTLIVFLNDNGGATINASSNLPLRGHKGTKFEGGIRVPFLVRWTGALPAGTTYARPVSALDVFATFLSAAGGASAAENVAGSGGALDGIDLLPYLRRERLGDPHEALFWRRGVVASVRAQDWKLIRIEGHAPLLFDLGSDPNETVDLADSRPQLVADLLARLDAWELETVEPRWRTAPYWTEQQVLWHTAPDERMHDAQPGEPAGANPAEGDR